MGRLRLPSSMRALNWQPLHKPSPEGAAAQRKDLLSKDGGTSRLRELRQEALRFKDSIDYCVKKPRTGDIA